MSPLRSWWKFDVLTDSAYRKAVTQHSPGLLRFAATMGANLRNPPLTPTGVATVLLNNAQT
jgi:hypothetical protein